MKRPLLLLLTALLCCLSPLAARLPKPANSFTLEIDYAKQLKKFPFIKPAEVKQSSTIKQLNNVVYSQAAGRDLHVDLFLPQKRMTDKPVVIIVHGGGWDAGHKEMERPMASALAERGIAALCVEYRLTGEALYPAAVQDIKCAIRWAKKEANKYHWNAQNIVLLGCSAGGQLVSLIGSRNDRFEKYQTKEHADYDDRVQKVVDIDGVLAFIHPESSEVSLDRTRPSAAVRWLGQFPDESDTLWHEASALTHVNPNTASFLFINSSLPRFHGGRDDMIKQMNLHGIYSEVHTLDNTPHTFWLYHPWEEQVVDRVETFVRRNV